MSHVSQFLIVACAVTAVAAITDLRTGQIPNWITLGLLAVGPIAHVAWWTYHFPQVGAVMPILQTVLGALVCAAVPYLLWRKNALGGGDLKLLAGLGALLGPVLGMQVQLYAFLAAAILMPARLAYQGRLLEMFRSTGRLALNVFRPKKRQVPVPEESLTEFRFGPCIFLAAAATAVVVY